MKNKIFLLLAAYFLFCGCNVEEGLKIQNQAQFFIDNYSSQYQKLYYEAKKAEWESNTIIIEGSTKNTISTRKAKENLASFTGQTNNIQEIKRLLKFKYKLLPIQLKQLEKMLYEAAKNPQTNPQLVSQRIKIETELSKKMYEFDFKIDGNSISTNDIDKILRSEKNLKKRLKVDIPLKSATCSGAFRPPIPE